MNAVLQCIFNIDAFKQAIVELKDIPPSENSSERTIMYKILSLFGEACDIHGK